MNLRIKLLKDITKIFNDNKLDFFPIYGTLLGFIRNKKLLTWDSDIDIGMWINDYEKLIDLKEKIIDLGYEFHTSKANHSGHINITPHIKEYDNQGVPYHMGISFWVKDKDNAIQIKYFDNNLFYRLFKHQCFTYNKFILKIRLHEVLPYHLFLNMKTINIHGIKIKVFSNPEIYLEGMYGKNWHIPIKTWDKTKHLHYNSFLKKYHFTPSNIRNIWGFKGMKILNLGCGYTKHGLRIDINPKCKPDIIADICLPLPIKDSFEMVTAIEVIEHVNNPQELIKNMLKHLSPYGVGIITTPNALGYEISYRYRGKKKINGSVQQYLTPCVIKGLINREGGKIIYQNIGSRIWLKHIEIIFTRK